MKANEKQGEELKLPGRNDGGWVPFLKDGQRQTGKDGLTHTTNIREVITCISLAHEFLTLILASFEN